MVYEAHLEILKSDVDRLATMVGAAPSLDKAVPRLEWTANQVASHVIVALRGLTGALRGDVSDLLDVVAEGGSHSETLAETNERALRMLTLTDPVEAAEGIRAVGANLIDAIAAATEADAPCPTPWYGSNATRPARVLAGVAHGEIVMHGLDIARALGKPWRISEATAAPIAEAAMTGMMPHMLKASSADFTGAFEIRLRGGPRWVMSIADGIVTIGESEVDCTISTQPSAALLVGYGRAPLWRLMAQGKIFAYGRRPWRALHFHSLFHRP